MLALSRLLFGLLAVSPVVMLVAPAARSGVTSPVAVIFPGSLKIVTYGSSSTGGLGASSHGAAYPAQLARVLRRLVPADRPVTVIQRGIPEATTDDLLAHLDSDVIANHPDLVVIESASTEVARDLPPDRFVEETRTIVRRLKNDGIPVILMEPQGCPGLEDCAAMRTYRDAILRIAAETNVTVIRRSSLMRTWIARGLVTRAELLAPNGIDLGDQGHAVLAGWVASEVLKLQAFGRSAADGGR